MRTKIERERDNVIERRNLDGYYDWPNRQKEREEEEDRTVLGTFVKNKERRVIC